MWLLIYLNFSDFVTAKMPCSLSTEGYYLQCPNMIPFILNATFTLCEICISVYPVNAMRVINL